MFQPILLFESSLLLSPIGAGRLFIILQSGGDDAL